MPRLIAYYLPQFHPIAQNDEWWGKGFTEWTNVTKAKPLFKGHQQPLLPGELGFYDLRLPEVREAQAALAKTHGLEGFCYWHYWFGNGKTIMEKPVHEVLRLRKPDFGYCFAWANQTWGGLDYGDGYKRILVEQVYPGKKDIEDHFYYVLPFFQDERYLKIDGKPIFQVNHARNLPESQLFVDTWNELALKNGLPGVYFIAHEVPGFNYKQLGFDGLNYATPMHLYQRYKPGKLHRLVKKRFDVNLHFYLHRKLKKPLLYDYNKLVEASDYSNVAPDNNVFPTAIPNWDHSPRSAAKATIITNSTPELFYKNLQHCWNYVKDHPADKQVIFIKSWNEWAEGNILEPDSRRGRAYLEVTKKFVDAVQHG